MDDFCSFSSLFPNGLFNLCGIVAAFKAPKKSKGTDFSQLITLANGVENSPSKATINLVIFRDKLEDFPPISQIGQVLLVKQIRCIIFDGSIQAISTFKFEWTLVNPFNIHDAAQFNCKIVANSTNSFWKNTLSERILLDILKLFQVESHITPRPRLQETNPKISLQKQHKSIKSYPLKKATELLRSDCKFDFIGEILAISQGTSTVNTGNAAVVYLSDFTINEVLMELSPIYFPLFRVTTDDSIDLQRNWASRPPKCVLQCVFWDQNAAAIFQSNRRLGVDFVVGDVIRCSGLHARIVSISDHIEESGPTIRFSLHGNATGENSFAKISPESIEFVDIQRQKTALFAQYISNSERSKCIETPKVAVQEEAEILSPFNSGASIEQNLAEKSKFPFGISPTDGQQTFEPWPTENFPNSAAKHQSNDQKTDSIKTPSQTVSSFQRKRRIEIDPKFQFDLDAVVNAVEKKALAANFSNLQLPFKFVSRFAVISTIPDNPAKWFGKQCKRCSRLNYATLEFAIDRCAGCEGVLDDFLEIFVVFAVRSANNANRKLSSPIETIGSKTHHFLLSDEANEYFFGKIAKVSQIKNSPCVLSRSSISHEILDQRKREICSKSAIFTGIIVAHQIVGSLTENEIDDQSRQSKDSQEIRFCLKSVLSVDIIR